MLLRASRLADWQWPDLVVMRWHRVGQDAVAPRVIHHDQTWVRFLAMRIEVQMSSSHVQTGVMVLYFTANRHARRYASCHETWILCKRSVPLEPRCATSIFRTLDSSTPFAIVDDYSLILAGEGLKLPAAVVVRARVLVTRPACNGCTYDSVCKTSLVESQGGKQRRSTYEIPRPIRTMPSGANLSGEARARLGAVCSAGAWAAGRPVPCMVERAHHTHHTTCTCTTCTRAPPPTPDAEVAHGVRPLTRLRLAPKPQPWIGLAWAGLARPGLLCLFLCEFA